MLNKYQGRSTNTLTVSWNKYMESFCPYLALKHYKVAEEFSILTTLTAKSQTTTKIYTHLHSTEMNYMTTVKRQCTEITFSLKEKYFL